ncbi:MAG: phage major capsid protein [Verrucomicrobiota bacterium]
MKRNVISLLILGALCLLPARAVPAAEPPPTVELQLRDRLRATMLQLRTAEAERAALQAGQTQWADEKKKLTERTEALTKQVNENKLTAQVVDGLKSQIAHQEKEIAQLKETVEVGKQAAELARNKEADRAKRVEEVVAGMERLVVDRQEKNLALYKIANEILQRYEKFGLGDAITAREPFTGITRVKLQNLVQDYQDKIASERVTLSEKDLATYRDKILQEASAKSSSQTSK